LEVQVAMILLAIGMSGLYSISVVQTRQTARLTGLLHPDGVLAINRVDNAWARKLGVYANIEDTVTAVNSPYPYQYYEAVIDEADGEPFVTHYSDPTDAQPEPWQSENDNKYYRDDGIYKVSHEETGSWIQFAFTGVPPGEYEVLTTYPAWTNNSEHVTHRIYDGTTYLGPFRVDQTQTPSDLEHDGEDWERFAVVEILSGTIRVRLVDGTGSEPWIIADGVMIRTARSLCLHSIDETQDGGFTAELVHH
jgi:hypothetical protein